MAINERVITGTTAEAGNGGAGSGNQEEGLILHLDANDVDSYDGDGSVWYDITNHEYKPATNVSENFNTVLYSGNGASNPITGVGFQPDLIWVKRRTTSTANHYIVDTVRGNGTNTYKNLASNKTDAEGTTTASGITNSTIVDGGFTMQGTGARTNASGSTYVAWCFKAGGAAVDNGFGSITSQVSANNDLGFSIVKYTGNGSSSEQTVGHGLDYKPELVIIKDLDNVRDWYVYTDIIDGSMDVLYLNKTDAKVNSSRTSPTSSVYKIAGTTTLNKSNQNFISYCFASKRGVSKVGSFVGTGTSGKKIYTGFEPAFIMTKRSSSSGASWAIIDNKRSTDSNKNDYLSANTSNTEATSSSGITFNRDGFTFNGSSFNTSGATHIYYAVAKNTNAGSLTPSTDGTEIETDLIFDPTQVHYSSTNYALEQDNTIWKGNASKSGGTHEGEVYFNNYFKSGDTGKYYFEVKLLEGTHFGVAFTDPTKYNPRSATDTGNAQDDRYFYGLYNNNLINSNGTNVNVNSTFASISNGDTISVAIDVATRKIWFGEVSGGTITWYGSGNPSSGTNEASVLPSGWNIYQPLVADTAYSGSSARYAWWQLNRTASATTLPTGFSYMTGAIKNADLELHLDIGNSSCYSGSGTTVNDLSSNNHTITTLAGVQEADFDEEVGNFLTVKENSNEGLSIADHADFDHNNGATYEGWVYLDPSGTYEETFFYRGPSNGQGLRVYWHASYGWFPRDFNSSGTEIIDQNNIKTGTTGFGRGKWYHLALTLSSHSDATYTFYVDGELIGSYSPTSGSGQNSQSYDISLGKYAGGWFHDLQGAIGQFRFYSSALTQDQIRQNFNFTKNDYPNGYNGTISGATWNSGGYFDVTGASNSGINIAGLTTQITPNGNDSTMGGWFKRDNTNWGTFWSKGVGSQYELQMANGVSGGTTYPLRYIFYRRSGSDVGQAVSTTNLSANTWYHIIGVIDWNNQDIKLYLNGSLIGTNTSWSHTTSNQILTGSIYLGRRNDNSGNLDGKVAEFKAYDKVLTASEITALFDENKSDYGY